MHKKLVRSVAIRKIPQLGAQSGRQKQKEMGIPSMFQGPGILQEIPVCRSTPTVICLIRKVGQRLMSHLPRVGTVHSRILPKL